MKRLIATLALATVALAAAACSTTNAGNGPSSPAAPADPNAPTVVAKDLQFVTKDVQVPAGKPFKLTFVNSDGAPHNVAIYTDASASSNLFRGEIVSGTTVAADVPALAAGTYFFRCDVHPDMQGTITAK